MNIKDMDAQHLHNVIAMLEREKRQPDVIEELRKELDSRQSQVNKFSFILDHN